MTGVLNFENSRWPTAAILQIVRSPYLNEQSSDFDEIWYTNKCKFAELLAIGKFFCPYAAQREILQLAEMSRLICNSYTITDPPLVLRLFTAAYK